MPLKIRLKPREKIIVNGAVLTAEDAAGSTIVLHNKAAILRARDIMQPQEANTPARRIYFQIMMMYIAPEEAKSFQVEYMRFLTDLLTTTTLADVKKSLLLIAADVNDGELYRALKTCRAVIKAEDALLALQIPDGPAEAAGDAMTETEQETQEGMVP